MNGLDEDAVSQIGLLERDGDVTVDHAEHDQRLGQRVRGLRLQRDLSLQALSKTSGLSSGMLSLIERGRATPSIRSLRSLGRALGVDISWFFAPTDEPPRGESPYIVRRSQRGTLRLTSTNIRKELVTPAVPGGLEIYEIVLEAGGTSGPEFAGQKGEKAGIVLEGSFRLWLEERAFDLTAGDSFRFPAAIAHRFDNPGRREARIYWIVSPQALDRTAASRAP